MVDLSELRPGMKVKLVDHWVPGSRNDWLGKIVTVRCVYEIFISIEEDQEAWAWFPAAIDHIVQDEEPLPTEEDFPPAPEDAFRSLFF